MTTRERLRRIILGRPKDIREPGTFHHLSLIAFLAWVGLGADGLSSSAYGPEETFRHLGEHRELSVFLALAMIGTVFIISYGYMQIIERFPSGGGGYLVASKVLGPSAGVVAGSALLVDYVLTITISMAAGADAIFSFIPGEWHFLELPLALTGVVVLSVMNLRGVKESVTAIAPVFALFIVTHAILLLAAIGGRASSFPQVSRDIHEGIGRSVSMLGMLGTLKVLMHAYSLGAGTYTGIEAISNGVAIMREPRVETARRTMVLMATSLAITASGLLLSYLIWGVSPVAGKTMNAVLLDAVAGGWTVGGVNFGHAFVIVALLSEGALLFVAAQAGFVGGPRAMANMAVDSWLPHRYAALSDRLTMRNGITILGLAAAAALIYTGGDVSKLVLMYAINVFITFSLSNIAMTVYWIRRRHIEPIVVKSLLAHIVAAALCVLILIVTISEKFMEGAWLTVMITSALIAFCFAVKRHYGLVTQAVRKLDEDLPGPESSPAFYSLPVAGEPVRAIDPEKPVAILLVGGYGGLGRHALLTLLRMFPGHFHSVIFVTVGVVDSDVFKGASELPALEARTRAALESYERFAAALDLASTSKYAIGTEVVAEAERLALEQAARYPNALVVGGQIVFNEDTSWNRLLHNETAFLIQRRLQHKGVPMIVLPVRLSLKSKRYRPVRALRGRPSLAHEGVMEE